MRSPEYNFVYFYGNGCMTYISYRLSYPIKNANFRAKDTLKTKTRISNSNVYKWNNS